MKFRNIIGGLLVSLLLVFSFAGVSNLDSLELKATAGDTNSLLVEDIDGTDIIKVAQAGDLTLGATGETISVPGNASFTGDVVLPSTTTYAVTKSFWIPVSEMKLPSANPATAGETSSIGTLEFVDSSADDHAWFTIIAPDDMDTTDTMEISVYYILPSGTPTEGKWNIKAIGLDDDEATAAATSALEIIYDTPSAAGDWNITTSATVPTTVTTKDMMNFILYHDVADPFGGTVEVAGVKVTYTSDKM